MDDPVCHVVAADHVPQPLSGSRTADSFFSFFMPSGSKSASLRMVTQRRTFCMHSFVYSPVYLPVIYIFTAYHPLIFTLCLYTAPSPHPVIFSTYFLPQHRCFHRFFLRRSADPPGSPPLHTPNGPALLSPAMFRPSPRYTYSCPRPAILTAALVPLYLQLPSSRYTCSCPLPVPSQVGMQFPKTSLLSALFAFCIVSPTVCLCPWIQIVYNV